MREPAIHQRPVVASSGAAEACSVGAVVRVVVRTSFEQGRFAPRLTNSGVLFSQVNGYVTLRHALS
jgi:hypothetical protein